MGQADSGDERPAAGRGGRCGRSSSASSGRCSRAPRSARSSACSAQQVLGQYDVAVPRAGTGALLFVVPNISAFEQDWSLDPTEFRTYVALHEVTHRFEFARPWARAHFAELVDDFLSTLKIDVGADAARQARGDRRLRSRGPAAGADERRRGMFGTVLDDEQRIKLGRIQAFMAAAEGYGDHVTGCRRRELLSSTGGSRRRMAPYAKARPVDPVFERLLGIEMKREQYDAGRARSATRSSS